MSYTSEVVNWHWRQSGNHHSSHTNDTIIHLSNQHVSEGVGEGGLYTTNGSVCGKVGNKTEKKPDKSMEGQEKQTKTLIKHLQSMYFYL